MNRSEIQANFMVRVQRIGLYKEFRDLLSLEFWQTHVWLAICLIAATFSAFGVIWEHVAKGNLNIKAVWWRVWRYRSQLK